MATPLLTQKSSQALHCDNDTLPRTPASKRSLTNTKTTLDGNTSPQTPSSTLRERRRRRLNNDENHASSLTLTPYRPLSLITQSVLMPFNFDANRVFGTIKSKEDTKVVPTCKTRTISTEQQRATPRKDRQNTAETPSPAPSNNQALEVLPIPTETSMDLLTALKTTSPEKDCSLVPLVANYSVLTELPVPDPHEHPAGSSSPFKKRTDLPILVTTSPLEEIRKNRSRTTKSTELAEENIGPPISGETIERKKSFFGLEIKSPISSRKKESLSASDESSGSVRVVSLTSDQPDNSIATVTKVVDSIGNTESGGNSGGSIRKFSDLFKSRTNQERSSTPSTPLTPQYALDSPNVERRDLEFFLRRTTNSPTYDYYPANAFPRHPNTGRGWRSRNLKCTNCTDDTCACCHRCCCAYKAAVLALDTHKGESFSRQDALMRIQEITRLFPYGKEAPTFLQCTRGDGEGGGCGRWVCPDCCSICPDEACGDTQCKKCKPLMWEECTWHSNHILAFKCLTNIPSDKPVALAIST